MSGQATTGILDGNASFEQRLYQIAVSARYYNDDRNGVPLPGKQIMEEKRKPNHWMPMKKLKCMKQ